MNRPNLLSFRDDDHLDPPAATTCGRPSSTHLRGEGVDPDGWQVTLVTNLRVLGYVFNPASFYLCRDAGRRAPGVVIVEVHNTHGERHLYTLRPAMRTRPASWTSMDKAFYVSPFIDMDGALHGPRPRRADAPADPDQ